MTTSTDTTIRSPHRFGTGLLLFLVATPATLAAALIGMLGMGLSGLAVPLVLLGAVLLHPAIVRSCETAQGRAAVREVGALLLAPAVGFGTWVALLFLGIVIEVVPFISNAQPYPYADEWNAVSVLAAACAACAAWWLLRRWADPSLGLRGSGWTWSG